MARKKNKKDWWKRSYTTYEEFEPVESVTLEPYDKVVYEAVCEAYVNGMYTYDGAFSCDGKRPTINFKTIYKLMKHAGKAEEEYQQEEKKIKKSLERLMTKNVRLDLSEEVRKFTKDETAGYLVTGHFLDINIWQRRGEPQKISLYRAPSIEDWKKEEIKSNLQEWIEIRKLEHGE